MTESQPLSDTLARPRRRDALANRERIVEAAVELFAEHGFAVPVADLADAAGVGIGTFYRSFPDRDALLAELAIRAHGHLETIIAETEAEGLVGLPAIRRFLLRSVEIGDRLVLPLHGAPPLNTPAARQSRARTDAGLRRFLDQARAAGAVVSDLETTDIVMCSALVSRPLRGSGPLLQRARRRQVEIFVRGLGGHWPAADDAVTFSEIEGHYSR